MTRLNSLCLCAFIFCLTACNQTTEPAAVVPEEKAQLPVPVEKTAPPVPVKTITEREAKFKQMMDKTVMVGHFTMANNPAAGAKEERYAIERIDKVSNELWVFHARIQYGKKDVTLPVYVPVKWAGDTPVIVLENVAIPGMGTFSARVLFHNGQYVGTWTHGKHTGQMYGRIVKAQEK